MFHAQEWAFEVDVEHRRPVVVSAVDDRRACLDRCTAHERVESTAATDRGVDDRRDLRLAGDIERHRFDPQPPGGQGVRQVPRGRFVDVGNHNNPTVARETANHCFAEAGCTPGNDRDVRCGRGRRGHRIAANPPSTGITAPDVYADSGEARYNALRAVSSVVPSRFRGMLRINISRNCSAFGVLASTLRNRGVSIEPGAITFARTTGPYSAAICFVSATSPA